MEQKFDTDKIYSTFKKLKLDFIPENFRHIYKPIFDAYVKEKGVSV